MSEVWFKVKFMQYKFFKSVIKLIILLVVKISILYQFFVLTAEIHFCVIVFHRFLLRCLYNHNNNKSKDIRWNWWSTFPRRNTSDLPALRWTELHFPGNCRCADTREIWGTTWERSCWDSNLGRPDPKLWLGLERRSSEGQCTV